MKIKLFFISILVSVCLMIISCQTDTPDQQIQLTALNSMQRILPSIPVKGKQEVVIKAARNEYEAFQVVIKAGALQHLKNVKVEISDLKNDDGIFTKNNLDLYREEHIFLPHSSPRAACPPGLYPDPLLPFINPVTGDAIEAVKKLSAPEGEKLRIPKYSAQPINIYPGQYSLIWVDVYIPKETKSGVYQGTLSATAEDGNSVSIPINLTVWDFTLPDVATHRTHLGHFNMISKVWGIDPHSEQYKNTEMEYCEELARHRVNPPIPHSLLPEVNDDGSIHIDPERHNQLVAYVERTHLVDFEIPRTKFMSNTSNSDRPTPANQTDPVAIEKSKRYYREMYQYIKENGWDKRAYLYLIDEPNSVKDYNQVINLARVVNEAAPDLQKLVVEQTYKHEPDWPDLDPSIDIWCALFSFIDRNTIQEAISNDDEVWSYSALVQPAPPYHPDYEKLKDKNPPYWHIDQPIIYYRLPTWINRQYDINGLLYWTTTGWYNNSGPWVVPAMGPLASSDVGPDEYRTRYFNGGGMLFYPGKDTGFDGPVTSIRLKNIREGLEDYEYFAILDRLGEGEFVIDMVNQICPNWWDFSKDPDKLMEVREQLALKIESLKK